MEVKKIACPCCGANIDFSKSDKVKCEYCHAMVYLDDKGQVSSPEEDIEKLKIIADDAANELNNSVGTKGFKIVFGLIFSCVIVFISAILILGITSINTHSKYSEYDISSFNNDLELFTGTNSGMFVSNLLDNVITKNKTDKDHVITVIYGEINTTDTDEIRQLKTNFEDFKNYEVSLDYDSDGFVNKVTIFDI
ncbi:MAG: hypothetical protein IKJ43_00115 [Bacilli bacterium]|nr:hypothetical protein [Bacilli bacterium]